MFVKLDELLFCTKWPFSLIIVVVSMVTLGLIAYFKKHLTAGGAIAAAVVGIVVLWCSRFEGFSILLFFYVSSYVIEAFTKKKNDQERIVEKKGSKRDSIQVMANGLVSAIAALIYFNTNKFIYLVMLGSAAAEATADTWAGELGRLSTTPPFSIRTGKVVEKGTSGGVTLTGFAGGLAGSALTAGFWQLAFSSVKKDILVYTCIIIVSGFIGCVLDSFLGATVQAMYEDSRTGKITEHDTDIAGNPQKLVRGIKWMDNDMVNLLSNIASGLIGLVLCFLF